MIIIAAMVSNSGGRWSVSATTFAVWLLAAASAVFWALKLGSAGTGATSAPVATRSAPTVDPAAVARLLGAQPSAASTPAAPNVASRFTLVGVIATATHQGAALISVDGKPARPYRVGSALEEGVVLRSVDARKAVLVAGDNGPVLATLELPLPLRR